MTAQQEERLVTPQGTTAVGEDDLQFREVDRDIVALHRAPELATRAREDARSCVHHHGHAALLAQFVDGAQFRDVARVGVRRHELVRRVDLDRVEPQLVEQVAHLASDVLREPRQHPTQRHEPAREGVAVARDELVDAHVVAHDVLAGVVHEPTDRDALRIHVRDERFRVVVEVRDLGKVGAALLDRLFGASVHAAVGLDVHVDVDDPWRGAHLSQV